MYKNVHRCIKNKKIPQKIAIIRKSKKFTKCEKIRNVLSRKMGELNPLPKQSISPNGLNRRKQMEYASNLMIT